MDAQDVGDIAMLCKKVEAMTPPKPVSELVDSTRRLLKDRKSLTAEIEALRGEVEALNRRHYLVSVPCPECSEPRLGYDRGQQVTCEGCGSSWSTVPAPG